MFCCFCLFILFRTDTLRWDNLLLLPVFLGLLLLASTVWGGMVGALCLFSRDSSLIMDFLETPMNLFSGTQIPVSCFPLWARALSLLFPLTYCLQLIRMLLRIGEPGSRMLPSFLGLGLCMAAMIGITVWVTRRVERHNRETGELNFF